jgi:hypothetical protein
MSFLDMIGRLPDKARFPPRGSPPGAKAHDG